MIRFLIFTFLIFLVFSCQYQNDSEYKTKKFVQDSTFNHIDSLMQKEIRIPPIYDTTIFNKATVNIFFALSNETDGQLYIAKNSKYVVNTLVDVIENHAESGAEIIFLIDKTGSMIDDIQEIKNSLDIIMDVLSDFKDIKIAFALYGDKNVDGPNWYERTNFFTNITDARNFLKNIEVSNGGDFPESVNDAIYKTINEFNWTSDIKRMILLLGDAPPLEPPFSDYTTDKIILKAKESAIKMNFYPIVINFQGDIDFQKSSFIAPKERNVISTVYPNPTNGLLHIVYKYDELYKIDFFDINGKLVKSCDFNGLKQTIDISDLTGGIYQIRSYCPSKNVIDTKKIILIK